MPEHHAIVYTGDIPPEPLSSEVESGQYEKMKPPIRITPDIPTSMLDPESRVNFSELYTVHIYSKVKPFGYVAEDLRWQLDLTRHQVFERIFPPVPRGLASSQPTAPLDSANAKSGPNKGKRRRRRRTTKEAGEVTNQATRGSEPGRIDGIG